MGKRNVGKYLSLVLLCLLITVECIASGNMEFMRLTVENGLSDNQVKCIYKDSYGYLWIGTTAGLNRYDGFRVIAYYHGANDGKSLVDDNISEIAEDAHGKLWLRTSVGYSCFDPVTGTFENDLAQWLAQYGMQGGLRHLFIDSQKRLWVDIYEQGVYCINSEDSITFVPHSELPDAQITAITEAPGIGLLTYDDGSLAAINGKTGAVEWINRHLAETLKETSKFYATFVDQRNNYWVYSDNTLQLYNTTSGQWKTLASYIIKDIEQDHNGRIWAATDHDGLVSFSPEGEVFGTYTHDADSHYAISDNTLNALYVDDIGILWIGTFKNGVNYHCERQSLSKAIPMGDICTITEDKQGLLWCGTNDAGIMCYDPATGDVTTYSKQQSGLGSDIVVSSLAASDGSLWFGTYRGGMACYADGKFTVYREQPGGLASDNVWALAEASDGRIIIGTLGAGVQILNATTGEFATYDVANNGLASDYISSLLVDGDKLHIAHSNYFSVLDLANGEITNFTGNKKGEAFCSRSANYLFLDSRNMLWLATTSGLNAYDLTTDELYTVSEQGMKRNADTYAVAEDGNGCMWVTSALGIQCICPVRTDGKWDFFISSVDETAKLNSRMYNNHSIHVTASGDIVAGSVEGLRIVSPDKITSNLNHAKVLFSGLQIFGNEIAVGQEIDGRVIMKRSLDSSRQLTLKHSDKIFTLQLAATNVGVPGQCRFVYRLRGENDNWTATAESQPDITFNNLAPGRYTLEVRLVDNMGRMHDEVSELLITIKPPFYLSGWAIAIYILVAGIIVWVLYRRMSQKREAPDVVSNAEQMANEGKIEPQITPEEITPLDKQLVADATAYVEAHLADTDLSVETMSQALNMSRVKLYRRLVAVTGKTPSEFIRLIRLRHAEQLLDESQLSIAEISYRVGFSNPRYFSKCFKELYGYMPSQRKKQ